MDCCQEDRQDMKTEEKFKKRQTKAKSGSVGMRSMREHLDIDDKSGSLKYCGQSQLKGNTDCDKDSKEKQKEGISGKIRYVEDK